MVEVVDLAVDAFEGGVGVVAFVEEENAFHGVWVVG